MDDWTRRLRACRQNLGSRTGEFWKENRGHLEIPAHERMAPGDPLNRLWKDQQVLFTRGDVQVGVIVMANQNLYRRAWVGGAALVLHGADPRVDPDVAALGEIADDVYALKHEDPDDPSLEPLAAKIRDELTRFDRVPVPAALAGGIDCVLTTAFLHRDAMPGRWLAGGTLPILSHVESTPAITLLPERYWPDELASDWRARSPTDACSDRPVLEVKGYCWPVPVLGIAALFATQFAVWGITGDKESYARLRWPIAVAIAAGGAAILAFDVYTRRPREPRWFAPTCGHPIDVRFDRRFLWLTPRIWSYVAFAAAVGVAIWSAVPR